MREIKFRGWVHSLKKMSDVFYLTDIGEYQGDTMIDSRYDSVYSNIMQYTGLKDKNEKEIYEGDIVEWNGYDYESNPKEVRFKGEVTFVCNKQAMLPETDEFVNGYFVKFDKNENGYRNLSQILQYQNTIIIGNIYENPELISNNK